MAEDENQVPELPTKETSKPSDAPSPESSTQSAHRSKPKVKKSDAEAKELKLALNKFQSAPKNEPQADHTPPDSLLPEKSTNPDKKEPEEKMNLLELKQWLEGESDESSLTDVEFTHSEIEEEKRRVEAERALTGSKTSLLDQDVKTYKRRSYDRWPESEEDLEGVMPETDVDEDNESRIGMFTIIDHILFCFDIDFNFDYN